MCVGLLAMKLTWNCMIFRFCFGPETPETTAGIWTGADGGTMEDAGRGARVRDGRTGRHSELTSEYCWRAERLFDRLADAVVELGTA